MASQSLSRYRPGCFERVEGTAAGLRLTKQGVAEVYKQAALGANPSQIAAHMRVSVDWFRQHIDPDHKNYDARTHDAFHQGRSELVTRLRENQLAMSESNAQMAIHLGKHYLDQHDRPVEHTHKHMVVGTMPNYDQTPEDWRKQFAPGPVQQITDEKTIDAEDAEVVDEAR